MKSQLLALRVILYGTRADYIAGAYKKAHGAWGSNQKVQVGYGLPEIGM